MVVGCVTTSIRAAERPLCGGGEEGDASRFGLVANGVPAFVLIGLYGSVGFGHPPKRAKSPDCNASIGALEKPAPKCTE